MKKIILGMLLTTIAYLPCQAQEIKLSLVPVKKAIVATGETTWRVAKYPFALTGLLARDVVNGEPVRTLRQAWILTDNK